MPKLVKPIRDSELQDADTVRREDIFLTPDTYSALVRLAKLKVQARNLSDQSPVFGKKNATEQALFWVKTRQADPKILAKLTNLALTAGKEELHEACLTAFLAANPAVKVREEGVPGRPKGFVPPAKQLKISMGEVIADLINSSPSAIRQLKVVK